MLKKILFTFFIVIAFCKYSFAEQQGVTSDVESQGQIEINLEITDLIKISGLNDFYFINWDKSNDMKQDDLVCVYSNNSNGRYNILAYGTGSNGNFEVSDGTRNIEYELYWSDQINSEIPILLNPNQPLLSENANKDYFDCNGANNAKITIKFKSNDLEKSLGSDYQGSLIVAISPE